MIKKHNSECFFILLTIVYLLNLVMYAETTLSEVDDDLGMFCTVVRFAQSYSDFFSCFTHIMFLTEIVVCEPNKRFVQNIYLQLLSCFCSNLASSNLLRQRETVLFRLLIILNHRRCQTFVFFNLHCLNSNANVWQIWYETFRHASVSWIPVLGVLFWLNDTQEP